MAIKAITKLTDEWFTPSDQEKEDNPAKFKIGPLNGAQHAEVISGLRNENGVVFLTHAGTVAALKHGLKDWVGVEDEEGKPISFSLGSLEVLPGEYWGLIAKEILLKTNITEEAEKKPD